MKLKLFYFLLYIFLFLKKVSKRACLNDSIVSSVIYKYFFIHLFSKHCISNKGLSLYNPLD